MLLDQDGNGNAFVAAVEVAVGAEFRAEIDGIAGILLEDTPFFTKNDAGDEPFFFASQEGFAKSSAKRAAFSCGAVAVDDFEGGNAGLFRLADFGKEKLAGFVDGGQTIFNIKSSEGGHGKARGHCA
jgi:hypothetical protein